MRALKFGIVLTGPAGQMQHDVDATVEIGREAGDVVVADPAVSRVHLRITAASAHLIAEDLGSSNGSFLAGRRLDGPTVVGDGDVIRIGDTDVRIVADVVDQPDDGPQGDTGSESTATPSRARAARSSVSLKNEAVEVRYVPGTAGEQAAKSYAALAKRARRNLAGFGSESWGAIPVVHLIGPYRDDGGEVVAAGSVVDASRGEAWVVVTAESPPEDPHRVLGLIFADALPNAAQLGVLMEGYALHLSGLPDSDEALVGRVPDLDDTTDELHGAAALSFVRFLLAREGDDGLRRVLAAPDGRADETFREVYGSALGQLEARWRRGVLAGEPDVDTGEFLKLSLKYLRPYKARQAEIFLYMLLSLAFVAAFPFVTKRLFDTALPSGEFSQVLTLLIGLAVAFTVSLLAGVRQAYQTAWISGAVTRDIRQTLFERVQRLPATWYREHPQGDVLSRLFSDVAVVQNGLSQAIGQGIFQVISLVTSSIIMLTINIWLGLLVLVAAPLVAFVYRTMATGARERSLALQEDNSALLNVAAENYQANPVVKMFGLGRREERRFAQQGERLFRSSRRVHLWSGMFGLSVNLIVTALRLTVLGLGAWLILEGHFTTGGLVAFLSIMGEVLSPVTVLVGLSQDVQQSMGSLVRIDEVMDAEPEPAGIDLPAFPPVAGEVRFTSVSLSYTPERRALDEFDVTIEAGSRVAIVGPSGSGKSTVLRLLMRMYEPDEGAILVDGHDLRSRSLESWRDQVGVVFQDSFLFDATLEENIALGRIGATDEEIRAAAEAAEVDTFIDALPDGYRSLVGEGGANLSGGQRQRVAIARALVRDPRVLILDEATSALDPRTEHQINDTIARAASGRTVVSVTHRLASIVDFDRILVLVEGRLAEQGTHEELLALGGTYAGLWSEQTGTAVEERAPEVDPADALRRIAFLADALPETIEVLVSGLTPFRLDPGRTLEDGGGLVLVATGTGVVVAGGGPVASLGPGDAFGVGAALGGAPAGLLEAREPMKLLVLPLDVLRGAARNDAALHDALRGGPDSERPPSGGTRLTRLTLGSPGPPSRHRPPPPPAPAVPNTTGAYPRMG